MLDCKFRELTEYPALVGEQEKTKLGRYHGSVFNGIGSGYVIGAYIDGDFEEPLKTLSEEELIKQCIEFLNSKMGRKSKKKKVATCIYGTLKDFKCVVKRDKNNKPYIEALLITSDFKNPHFWGEGKEKDSRR